MQNWFLRTAERGNPATGLDRADGTAWSSGNEVRAVIDGAELFARLRAELADVRRGDQIYFAAWTGTPQQRLGEDGPTIAEAFAGALTAGAHVHALFWCPYVDLQKDFVPENREFAAMLRALGGSAVLDQRLRAVGSHHQKFLVIRRPGRPEQDVAFVGGIDPCPSRRDDTAHDGDPQVQDSIAPVYGQRPAWHDAHVQLRGPAVADVERCFRERWEDSTSLRRLPFRRPRRGSGSSTVELPEPQPVPPECGHDHVQVLRTYPKKTPPYPFAPRGEDSIARAYRKVLRAAEDFVYVEDQFLWSPMVAEEFAAALRRNPRLRLVAVLAARPDRAEPSQVAVSDLARGKAVQLLRRAGGRRFACYELVHPTDRPIFVHSKVCVVDDAWATVGSLNLNRRSWTYDSELNAAVVSDGAEPFAARLRRQLWREHTGREDLPDDPQAGIEAMRECAEALDRWYEGGRSGPRPGGFLRTHVPPRVSALTKLWAVPAARLLFDPDGRPGRFR